MNRWFAWYPVKTEDTERWVWLKWIYRLVYKDSFSAATCAFERTFVDYYEGYS